MAKDWALLDTTLHWNVDREIWEAVEKTDTVSNDIVLIEDSENNYSKKKVRVGNLPFSISKRQTVLMGGPAVPEIFIIGSITALSAVFSATEAQPVSVMFKHGTAPPIFITLDESITFSDLIAYAKNILFLINDGIGNITGDSSVYPLQASSSKIGILANFEGGYYSSYSGMPYYDSYGNEFLLYGTILSASVVKYGATSLYVPALSSAEVFNPTNLIPAAWTIEGWFYLSTVSSVQFLVGGIVDGLSLYSMKININASAKVVVYLLSDATGGGVSIATLTSTTSVTISTWVHLAIEFDGYRYQLYINGAADATAYVNSTTPIYSVSGTAFKWFIYADNNYYLDDFRYTPYARYKGAFTAPAAALTVDSGIGFIGTNSRAICANFEGANNQCAFLDFYNNTFLFMGSSNISTAQYKFGSSAGRVLSATSYISFLAPILTDPWTIEFWARVDSLGSTQYILSASSFYSIAIWINATGVIYVSISTNGTSWAYTGTSTPAMTAGAWCFFNLSWDGATYSLYAGPAGSAMGLVAYFNVTLPLYHPTSLYLGASSNGFIGYVDNFVFLPYCLNRGTAVPPITANTAESLYWDDTGTGKVFYGYPGSWVETLAAKIGEAITNGTYVSSVVHADIFGVVGGLAPFLQKITGNGLMVYALSDALAPVVATWANGFTSRLMDYVEELPESGQWESLTPYANPFLYIENDGLGVLAYGHSVYQPVYDSIFKGVVAGAILANFEGADEALTYTDLYNNIWTLANGCKLDNAQKKFNATTSLCFSGTDDYAQCQAPDMSGKWTIEFWFRCTDTTSAAAQELIYSSAAYQGPHIYINTSGKIVQSISSNGTTWNLSNGLVGTDVMPDATWVHYALVFDGTSYKTYINGTEDTALRVTSSSSIYQPLHIRLGLHADGVSYDYTGYMEGFRYSPYARYTVNFTAPAAAFIPDEVHFFNLNKMVMYKGYPSSWTKCWRLFVGECITDAAAVSSVITYALNGKYTERITIAITTTYSKSHNLGLVNYITTVLGALYAGGPLYTPVNYYDYGSSSYYSITPGELKRNTCKIRTGAVIRVWAVDATGFISSAPVEIEVTCMRAW